MKKIYLSDNIMSGHHCIYESALKNIKGTKILNFEMIFTDAKKNIIKAYKERIKFLELVDKNSEDFSIINLLYLDSLYKCPFVVNALNNNKKYVGTLHWVPNNFMYKKLLKKFCERLDVVVVHSEYLQKQLNLMGINNTKYIDYPSFLKCDLDIKKKDENIILSCLGGTRLDKGLDTLISSFKYIPDSCKDKLKFNICGIEQDIKYSEIIKAAKKYKINIITKNKFLTDKEYELEIKKSDVILLPYKSYFSGNSGPMTDGIYMNKFILGPKEGNLGFLIEKYNLGATFKNDSSKELAKEIANLCNVKLEKDHEYRNMLSIETFLEKYKKIYNSL